MPFPVVGIGASAGGLEAFIELVKALPPETGMAFVFVQHLDPAKSSILSEVLARHTPMLVREIEDGCQVEPNHVYVIPPSYDLTLMRGRLTLLPRSTETQPHLSIDLFFRSLAAEQGAAAIGVVLSGTGADGTLGLKSIKGEGGITYAQTPISARFDGMPASAISAGVVDGAHRPSQIAAELARIAAHPYMARPAQTLEPLAEKEKRDLARVLAVIRDATGVDFGEYKESTVRRRLARRLALHRLGSLHEYLQFLQETPAEAESVFEDFLIHVTSFFRDPDAFEGLKKSVFPVVTRDRRPGTPIRMWAAGCSTGEEAYSLAIAYLEFLGPDPPARAIQVFGGDLSLRAIEKARAGFYPTEALADVSEERLRRYFTRVDGGYRVAKLVRDACVFSRHDVARDPPFSRMDLISCRNVLIYFDQPMQSRVVSSFHHSLNQPGFLLVGRSETIPPSNLFAGVGDDSKVYARVPLLKPPLPPRPLAGSFVPPRGHVAAAPPPPEEIIAGEADATLLKRYSPPGVIVDDRMEILQFRGRTGPWLEPAAGQPQQNLLRMARPGLAAELRIALSAAKSSNTAVVRNDIAVEADGTTRICDVVVLPFAKTGADAKLYLVLFEEKAPPVLGTPPVPSGDDASKAERELGETRAYLQTLIEEHQRTNDDLAASNAELMSGNEELQSLNEEMETAKEELQSTNEELNSVNDELQNRNEELGRANNDLVNILASVEIPILILDAERRLRRFTPKARAIMNVLPTDIGRPIEDIRPNVTMPDLDQEIGQAIEQNTIRETDVKDRSGRWYRLQIRPYKTTDNRIDGAVLSLLDIDALKRAVTVAEWARDYAKDIVESVPIPLVVLDTTVSVLSANATFYRTFGGSPAETEGRSLFAIGNGMWAFPELQNLMGDLLPQAHPFDGIEVSRVVPRLGRRILSLSARPIQRAGAKMPMILLAIEDVTDQRRAETKRTAILEEAQEAKADAEGANRAKDLFLAVLSHELRTPLNTLVLQSQVLRKGASDPARVVRAADAIERAAKTQAQLIEDLLDISRIVSGKLTVTLAPIDFGPVVRAGLEAVAGLAHTKGVLIEAMLDQPTPPVSGDGVRLQQVVWNLMTNSIKFTPKGGRVIVKLEPAGNRVRLRVCDTGIGIEPEFLPRVFDRFAQADSSSTTRATGGLGLGMAIVRSVVEMHNGTITVDSAGKGTGTTFTLELPAVAQLDKQPPDGSTTQPPKKKGSKRLRRKSSARSVALARPILSGIRVLLVEDDSDTLDAVAELLTHHGAIVSTASNASQALGAFEASAPDLLLLDIGLPGEDGYSLLAKLHAKKPGLPAVAVTAFASAEDRARSLAAGFAFHLPKPIDSERLVSTISAAVLGRPAPAQPAN